MNFRSIGKEIAAAIAAVAMGTAQAVGSEPTDRTFEDCVNTPAIDYVLRDSPSFVHGFKRDHERGHERERDHERELSVGNGWKYDSRDYWSADEGAYCAPIPEPETYAMMALGLAVVSWTVRRRRSQPHA